jgi:hypothetical protein
MEEINCLIPNKINVVTTYQFFQIIEHLIKINNELELGENVCEFKIEGKIFKIECR